MATLVPLESIVLSPVMVEMIKSHDPNFDESKYTIVDNFTLPLSEERLESVLDIIKTDDEKLPDVKLKIYQNEIKEEKKAWKPKRLRDTAVVIPPQKVLYSIIDGRHRVVASILLGMTHVRSKIYMNYS